MLLPVARRRRAGAANLISRMNRPRSSSTCTSSGEGGETVECNRSRDSRISRMKRALSSLAAAAAAMLCSLARVRRLVGDVNTIRAHTRILGNFGRFPG